MCCFSVTNITAMFTEDLKYTVLVNLCISIDFHVYICTRFSYWYTGSTTSVHVQLTCSVIVFVHVLCNCMYKCLMPSLHE